MQLILKGLVKQRISLHESVWQRRVNMRFDIIIGSYIIYTEKATTE